MKKLYIFCLFFLVVLQVKGYGKLKKFERDTINIHLKNNHSYSAVLITDAKGVIIDQMPVPAGIELIQIPIASYDLKPGIYFVKLSYKNSLKTVKVFKIKDPTKPSFPNYRRRSSSVGPMCPTC